MDVHIRVAEPAELDEVSALTVDVYGGEQLADDEYLPVVADVESRASAPLTEVVVAVEPGTERLLGAFTFCRYGSPFAAIAEAGEAEIRMLAVGAEARRRGVGEALVRWAVERARGYGCTRVALYTMPVMLAAHRLYERTGFSRVPARDLEFRSGFRLLAYALDL